LSFSDFVGGADDGLGITGTGEMHDRNLGAGYGGVKPTVPEMNLGRGGGGGGGGAEDDAAAIE
jgi:hypothetical protein